MEQFIPIAKKLVEEKDINKIEKTFDELKGYDRREFSVIMICESIKPREHKIIKYIIAKYGQAPYFDMQDLYYGVIAISTLWYKANLDDIKFLHNNGIIINDLRMEFSYSEISSLSDVIEYLIRNNGVTNYYDGETHIPFLVSALEDNNIKLAKLLIQYNRVENYIVMMMDIELKLFAFNHNRINKNHPYIWPKFLQEYHQHMYLLSEQHVVLHGMMQQNTEIFEPELVKKIMEYTSYALMPEIEHPH